MKEYISIVISAWLLFIISFLVFMHLASIASAFYFGGNHFITRQLSKLFYLDAEYNVPAWFSSSLLLICGLSLMLVSYIEKQLKIRSWFPWFLLGAIFFALSLDESISLHEWMIEPMRKIVPESGVLYQAWVVPGLAFVVIVAIVFIPFLLKLPSIISIIMVLSGGIYLGGALGLEMVGGYIFTHQQTLPIWLYTVCITFEELFEMLGLVLFLHGALSYLVTILKHDIYSAQ